MQTLKHIVVNIDASIFNIDEDPLSGIPSELEDMRAKNIIETVTIMIRITVRTGANYYQLGGDDWDRLDEVLTTPGWFSLKKVSLTIAILVDIPFKMSDQLEETYFLRLSSSNSVSFDFNITSKSLHE